MVSRHIYLGIVISPSHRSLHLAAQRLDVEAPDIDLANCTYYEITDDYSVRVSLSPQSDLVRIATAWVIPSETYEEDINYR